MSQSGQLHLRGARQPLASGHQPARRAREGSGLFRLPRPRSDATNLDSDWDKPRRLSADPRRPPRPCGYVDTPPVPGVALRTLAQHIDIACLGARGVLVKEVAEVRPAHSPETVHRNG